MYEAERDNKNMKILNLKINNFGKLSNKNIELSDGINVIYGENESGKSTLLKFIMGMFYGLSKNKNGKFIPDYERYTPWNGGEFSGKITYKLDNGNKYEVFREFKKKNPKIYNEDLEDISNTFNIDKTTGNKFFYDQTGVDEELFSSTIVSFQEETKLEEKQQLALVQKMSNLASTGEDNISYQKIISNLNKRQIEEIGTNRTQDRPINVVTRRLEEIQKEKEELSNFSNKQYEIEEEKQTLENKIKEQERELELVKELKNIQEKQHLEKEKIKVNQDLIKEYNKKIEKLQRKQVGIENNTQEKSEEATNENKETIKKLVLNKEKIVALLTVIFILLTIVSIFVIKNDYITALSIVLLIVTSIYLGYTQYRKKIGIIKSNNLQNVENNSIKNEIEVLTKSTIKLEQETKQTINKLEEELKNETEKIRNKYIGIIPIKTIDETLSKESLIFELSTLQNQISENKVKLHSIELDKSNIIPKLENLAELEEEYSELEQRYNELKEQNELINLAKEEIQNAYNIMKNNVTPKFTNNLSKIIEKISSGKYKNVKLDEENGMIVEIENGNYIKAEHLSIGTIDELYLSLRLGAGLNISEEILPIILDESFAYCDNIRLENILKYLNEEFKTRQIILFTCTNREQEILDKLNIKYNRITLGSDNNEKRNCKN